MGKILSSAGSLPPDCWISDISHGGARLHSDGGVPNDFTLVELCEYSDEELMTIIREGTRVQSQSVPITRSLNERKIPTPRGCRWHVSAVANLVARTQRLAGLR